MREIDSEWIKKQIQNSDYGSVRALSRAIEDRRGERFDHSYLVRILNGERKMHLQDLEDLCVLLKIPVIKMLKKSGFEIPSKLL